MLVAAKIAIREDVAAVDLVASINAAEARVRAAEPHATVICLEPDFRGGGAEPATPPTVGH